MAQAPLKAEAGRPDGAAGRDPQRLTALRAEIAKIAGQAGINGFSQNYINSLNCDAAALQKHELRIPLGRNSRFDRLIGGGVRPGTLTEILAARPGDAAAATGFLLGLAARLAARRDKAKAAIFWIAEDFAGREQGGLYGPGLALYGFDPSRLVFVTAASAGQALWAMEEALRSRAPAVVIGELWSAKPYDLTASRRLLLAAQRQDTPALLCLAGSPGAADHLSSGADLRFEIRAQKSRHLPSAGTLPLPGAAAFAVRIAKARIEARIEACIKARAGPENFGIDRDRFHPLIFDHDEALFRDALPLALAPDACDRSDRPALAQG